MNNEKLEDKLDLQLLYQVHDSYLYEYTRPIKVTKPPVAIHIPDDPSDDEVKATLMALPDKQDPVNELLESMKLAIQMYAEGWVFNS